MTVPVERGARRSSRRPRHTLSADMSEGTTFAPRACIASGSHLPVAPRASTTATATHQQITTRYRALEAKMDTGRAATEESPTVQLIADKLDAFERIRADFDASFAYVQDVHGQRRFTSFSVTSVVRYQHALWICDCKDMLLSVPQGRSAHSRYGGKRALEVLRSIQEGDTGDVVALLERKLGRMSFTEITRGFQAATQNGDDALTHRLAHGRRVLLNRAHNLECALETIFALSPERLIRQARTACAQLGYTVPQIDAQLAALQTPLYGYVRHPALAACNMVLMNTAGVRVTDNDADRPGRRTWRVQFSPPAGRSYAEQVIVGATTLVSEWSNNPALVFLYNRRNRVGEQAAAEMGVPSAG